MDRRTMIVSLPGMLLLKQRKPSPRWRNAVSDPPPSESGTSWSKTVVVRVRLAGSFVYYTAALLHRKPESCRKVRSKLTIEREFMSGLSDLDVIKQCHLSNCWYVSIKGRVRNEFISVSDWMYMDEFNALIEASS